MSARDVIADWIHFEASIQNGFENSRGKSVNDHADDILAALGAAGLVVVPKDPTDGMVLAAIMLPNDPKADQLKAAFANPKHKDTIERTRASIARALRAAAGSAPTTPEVK